MDPKQRSDEKIRSVSDETANSSDVVDDSSIGDESFGYDGGSESSLSLSNASTTTTRDESENSGRLATATAPRPSGNRRPPAECSRQQARVVDGPEVLSEMVHAVYVRADEKSPDPTNADTVFCTQVPADEDYMVHEHLQKLHDAIAEALDGPDRALVRKVLQSGADIRAKLGGLGCTNVAMRTIVTGTHPQTSVSMVSPVSSSCHQARSGNNA